jgi:beta-galactosidase
MKNGNKEAEGVFDLDLQPKGEKDFKIIHPALEYAPGTEYYLNIYAYTRKADAMTPANFEVAREQFAYDGNNYVVRLNESEGKHVLSEINDKVKIEAGKVILIFNRQQGTLDSYSFDGMNLLEYGPEINFWRAPTDNDFGNGMQRESSIWREAGESRKIKDFEVKQVGSAIIVRVKYLLTDIASEYSMIYTVVPNGALKIEAEYQTGNNDLPEMPRFGMLLTLPVHLNYVNYYGRGPLENYSDRKFSSFIGKYEYKVSEQVIPYVRPQEYGNRTDVRWITLTDQNGKGIRIDGFQPLNFSALNNRPEDFDPGFTKKQQHPKDILRRFDITLAVDLAQRGLGGDNSWGALPHQVYRLLGKSYKYSFLISPVGN